MLGVALELTLKRVFFVAECAYTAKVSWYQYLPTPNWVNNIIRKKRFSRGISYIRSVRERNWILFTCVGNELEQQQRLLMRTPCAGAIVDWFYCDKFYVFSVKGWEGEACVVSGADTTLWFYLPINTEDTELIATLAIAQLNSNHRPHQYQFNWNETKH